MDSGSESDMIVIISFDGQVPTTDFDWCFPGSSEFSCELVFWELRRVLMVKLDDCFNAPTDSLDEQMTTSFSGIVCFTGRVLAGKLLKEMTLRGVDPPIFWVNELEDFITCDVLGCKSARAELRDFTKFETSINDFDDPACSGACDLRGNFELRGFSEESKSVDVPGNDDEVPAELTGFIRGLIDITFVVGSLALLVATFGLLSFDDFLLYLLSSSFIWLKSIKDQTHIQGEASYYNSRSNLHFSQRLLLKLPAHLFLFVAHFENLFHVLRDCVVRWLHTEVKTVRVFHLDFCATFRTSIGSEVGKTLEILTVQNLQTHFLTFSANLRCNLHEKRDDRKLQQWLYQRTAALCRLNTKFPWFYFTKTRSKNFMTISNSAQNSGIFSRSVRKVLRKIFFVVAVWN
jgi:hypothetical protein